VLVTEPSVSIEMHDIQIDDPDIDISLPIWLEWAGGVLTNIIAGPVFGALFGFLFSSIISSLAEAFIPSNLGSKVPPPGPQKVTGLPRGVKLSNLSVVPEYLQIMGSWYPYYEDPRPFWPRVVIVNNVESKEIGIPHSGTAYFVCLGVLGVVMDSNPEYGTPFEYLRHTWRSKVTAQVEATAVPLPLTLSPWTIAVGYRSPEMYHFPVIPMAAQPLVSGPLTITCDVWRPEPPLGGTIQSQTFTIDVQRSDDNVFTLDVPSDAFCILIELQTKVVDASGDVWDLAAQIDVMNQTVVFGNDFDSFTSNCASHRRDFLHFKVPTLLDQVWNPPDVYSRILQEAIRTEQPAVTNAIESLVARAGKEAFNLILAPSLVRDKQRR
jgi:hypothetical protein